MPRAPTPPDERLIAHLRVRLEEAAEEAVVGAAIGPALWPRLRRVAQAICASELHGTGIVHHIRCDAETNPPELARAGGVGFEVALRFPARAELVIIRVVHAAELPP